MLPRGQSRVGFYRLPLLFCRVEINRSRKLAIDQDVRLVELGTYRGCRVDGCARERQARDGVFRRAIAIAAAARVRVRGSDPGVMLYVAIAVSRRVTSDDEPIQDYVLVRPLPGLCAPKPAGGSGFVSFHCCRCWKLIGCQSSCRTRMSSPKVLAAGNLRLILGPHAPGEKIHIA